MIYVAPTLAVPIMALAQWVNDRAEEGTRIICIDPITAAQVVRIPGWKTRRSSAIEVKKAVVTHGCSLVIVTHPAQGRQPNHRHGKPGRRRLLVPVQPDDTLAQEPDQEGTGAEHLDTDGIDADGVQPCDGLLKMLAARTVPGRTSP